MKITAKIILLTFTSFLFTIKIANGQSTTSTNAYNLANYIGWGINSGDLPFKTNDITRATLKNNTGYLGIGTSTPLFPLHVVGINAAPSTTLTANGVFSVGVNGTNIALTTGVFNGFNNLYSWIQSRNHTIAINFYNLALQPLGGNVGIGLTSPPSKLSILGGTDKGSGFSINRADVHTCIYNQLVNTNAGVIQVYSGGTANTVGNTPYTLQLQPEGGNVGIGLNSSNPTAKLTVNGNLLIGDPTITLPTGYKLYVQTGILTEKIKVALTNSSHWADYVFEENYELKPLLDIETYIKINNHLPNVPSAEELVKNGGIDVNEMFVKQMEKIEELTLYLIDLQKQIDNLKKEKTILKAAIFNNPKK